MSWTCSRRAVLCRRHWAWCSIGSSTRVKYVCMYVTHTLSVWTRTCNVPPLHTTTLLFGIRAPFTKCAGKNCLMCMYRWATIRFFLSARWRILRTLPRALWALWRGKARLSPRSRPRCPTLESSRAGEYDLCNLLLVVTYKVTRNT